MRNVAMPQWLYHGTTISALPSFQKRILEPTYWKPNRDFGAGFYSTISLSQAKRWAKQVTKKDAPCVLQVELLKLTKNLRAKVFLSPSLEWAAYIYHHRTKTTRTTDPCGLRHAHLIVGPCADGDTGFLVREAIQFKKNMEWFHAAILHSKKGRSLDPEQLDSQIVFSEPSLEFCLRLAGYYVLMRGVWRYAEIQDLSRTGPL